MIYWDDYSAIMGKGRGNILWVDINGIRPELRPHVQYVPVRVLEAQVPNDAVIKATRVEVKDQKTRESENPTPYESKYHFYEKTYTEEFWTWTVNQGIKFSYGVQVSIPISIASIGFHYDYSFDYSKTET